MECCIEIGQHELEIEVEYYAIEGEPPGICDTPSQQAGVDLTDVFVLGWYTEDRHGSDLRERDESEVWPILDEMAVNLVAEDWPHFSELCMGDLIDG